MTTEAEPRERLRSGVYTKAGEVAHILRGVVAAFHCRGHLERGDFEAARHEYHLLEQSLEAIARSGVAEQDHRVAMLREAEHKLRDRLARAVARTA